MTHVELRSKSDVELPKPPHSSPSRASYGCLLSVPSEKRPWNIDNILYLIMSSFWSCCLQCHVRTALHASVVYILHVNVTVYDALISLQYGPTKHDISYSIIIREGLYPLRGHRLIGIGIPITCINPRGSSDRLRFMMEIPDSYTRKTASL